MKRSIIIFILCLLFIKILAMGSKTEQDIINSSSKIKEFIVNEVNRNESLKEVEKQAKKLGKKQGLVVAFVDSDNYNATKVNIMLNLGNKSPLISSFEVEGGKVR